MERHVADDLLGRFLEREVQAPLAAAAGAVGEGRGEAALARAGRAGDQDAAAPVVALAAQHRVQPRDAAWRSAPWRPGSCSPSELIGSTRQAVLVDQRGYSFVPWAEPRYLTIRSRRVATWLMHPVVQEDHAVADVFLQAVAGERVRRPARR